MPIKVKDWEKQIEFDVYRVNTRVMNQFFKSAAENVFEAIADVFAMCLTSLPKEWGDPSKIDDLLENIPYPCMREMLSMFTESFKDSQKN